MMNDRDLTALLAARGVRPTQQRIAVYHYLLAHRTHPSADAIYQALSREFPVFSRTTIYNTLNTLADAGLISVINIRADEQRFDACTEDHGHFLCSVCDTIYDVPVDEARLSSLCPDGFACTHSHVYFHGVCPRCASAAAKAALS